MKQHRSSQNLYKSRKTPSRIYVSEPPKIESSVEMFYHAINDDVMAKALAPVQDRIVTSRVLYKPGLLAHARIDFYSPRWEFHHEREIVKMIAFPPLPQLSNWEKTLSRSWETKSTLASPQDECWYDYDSTFDFSETRFDDLQEDFLQFLLSSEVLELDYNPSLKICRGIEESDEAYFGRCLEKAHEEYGQEIKNLAETMTRLQSRLKERMDREVREIKDEAVAVSEPATARKKRRRAPSVQDYETEWETREAMLTVEEIKKESAEVQQLYQHKMKELEDTVVQVARQEQKMLLRINRGNVHVLRFALVWLPYTELVIQDPDSRRVEVIQSF